MGRTGGAVVGIALVMGCGARAVPPNDVRKAARCVEAPVASVSASAAPSEAPAVEAPRGPVATAVPDGYGDCSGVRHADSNGLDASQLAAARAGAWLWPPRCGEVSGWAGIGMVMSGQAAAFSADGKRFVGCGAWGDVCDVVDLGRDVVVQRVTSAWPDGVDGSPVTSTPTVKKLLRQLGAPAPEGRFPYLDDVRVSWKVGDGGGSLYVSFVLLATGDERIVHRFPGHAVASEQPLVLTGARLSPDGGVLELDVFSGQGGTGFEIALVNVHAEAAALFRSAPDPEAWAKKAGKAEEQARRVARSFIE